MKNNAVGKTSKRAELVRCEVKALFTKDPSEKTFREISEHISKTLGDSYVSALNGALRSLVKSDDPFLLTNIRGVYTLREDYSAKFYFNRSIENLKTIVKSINLIECNASEYDQLLKLRDALLVFEQSVIDA